MCGLDFSCVTLMVGFLLSLCLMSLFLMLWCCSFHSSLSSGKAGRSWSRQTTDIFHRCLIMPPLHEKFDLSSWLCFFFWWHFCCHVNLNIIFCIIMCADAWWTQEEACQPALPPTPVPQLQHLLRPSPEPGHGQQQRASNQEVRPQFLGLTFNNIQHPGKMHELFINIYENPSTLPSQQISLTVGALPATHVDLMIMISWGDAGLISLRVFISSIYALAPHVFWICVFLDVEGFSVGCCHTVNFWTMWVWTHCSWSSVLVFTSFLWEKKEQKTVIPDFSLWTYTIYQGMDCSLS